MSVVGGAPRKQAGGFACASREKGGGTSWREGADGGRLLRE